MDRDPRRARPVGTALACLGLALLGVGCASIKAHDPHLRETIRDHRERRQSMAGADDPRGRVLAREGLLDLARRDPGDAASLLETRLADHPEADGALALADLSYREGLRRQSDSPGQAVARYRDAAALATLALRGPDLSRPDLAVGVHNHAVARLVRVAQGASKGLEGGWRRALADRGVVLASSSPELAPDRFADLTSVDDVRITGMNHTYRNDGLGVPLIAHRRVDPSGPIDPLDRFHPLELRSAATAVITPVGGLADREWRRNPATLALFDPFEDRSIRLGDRDVPLAGDRTTPRAVQVAEGGLPALEMAGLFDSDFRRPGVEAGLYLFRAHKPGKIPVVLVHGLFSSPRAFVQTMNELENDPDLADRFEFWVFLYPTGQPIPASALQLRGALVHIRDTLDPAHVDPALDRIVLVGHSMGGLLSKMMVQDTGPALWDAAFRRPLAELEASPETRAILEAALIFRPMPFVARVVFIATPHRGSPIADQPFGRAIASLIHRSRETNSILAELARLDGPDAIAPELRRAPLNAVGNLRTDSPILRTLARLPIDPKVPYHSIIPRIGGVLPTDGVVAYPSAHLDGAASEMLVAGTHSAQQLPEVTDELRRILKLHLAGH